MLRSAYHQNRFPTTPDKVRYDFCTLLGSVAVVALGRKNGSRGGDDSMTCVTGARREEEGMPIEEAAT